MSLTHLSYLIGACLVGIFFVFVFYFRVKRSSVGSKKMREISRYIREGAFVFLNRQYKVIFIYTLIVASLLFFLLDDKTTVINEGLSSSLTFVIGALTSLVAGNIGMRIATRANLRTTNAARTSLRKAFNIAFSSGVVTGLSVVSFGLLGIILLLTFYEDPNLIFGFSLGASSIALFARVGGGIYTKGADIGADLVGKLELGISEDDYRNPAVIADNVGDNVGDVAGMSADLYESYVGSIIASVSIGLITFGAAGLFFPLLISAGGIIASIIGIFFVRVNDEKKIHKSLRTGVFVSSFILGVFAYFTSVYFMKSLNPFLAILTGLFAGIGIGLSTEYYTSYNYKPTKRLAESSQTGSATNIIYGLSLGMKSTVIPVLIVGGAILISYHFSGLFGISIAAVGMLSTLGITLGIDAYGPVVDNAGGIAVMSKATKITRKRTDVLDSVGNTTAAVGKGFAIGSAALTSLAFFSVYSKLTHLNTLDVLHPSVIVGLLFGATMPFLFSAITMRAVGKVACNIILEVRRQFSELNLMKKRNSVPDYNKCVDIATVGSIKRMIFPSLLAIFVPLLVGFLSVEVLGGFLVGSIVSGFILAIFMANAGGAWDNAKKYIEKGNFGGANSESHRSSIVGDTVGDPFKDCSGPSINILIKLMSIVALVFAHLF